MDWGLFLVGVVASVYRGLSLLRENFQAIEHSSVPRPSPEFGADNIKRSVRLIASQYSLPYRTCYKIGYLEPR